MFTELGNEIRAKSWLNDERLSARAGVLIEQLGNIGNSIPASTGSDSETRAAYRFGNNEKVTERGLQKASLFACAARLESREHNHIHLLTRAQHDRQLWIDKKQGKAQPTKLKTAVAGLPCAGCIGLNIREDKTDPKRSVPLEVRFRKVTIAVPHDLKSYHKDKKDGPFPIWVVEVREITPIQTGQAPFEPLHWFLITSLTVADFAQALQIIRFYTLRWRVEDFHVVLKQGCAVEKLPFKYKHALQNWVVLYSIVSVQHLRLRYLHEVKPDAPIEVLGLPTKAYSVAEQYWVQIRKIKLKAVPEPTIADFFKLIALIATGKVPNTGFRALWVGLTKFNRIWDTYCAFNDS